MFVPSSRVSDSPGVSTFLPPLVVVWAVCELSLCWSLAPSSSDLSSSFVFSGVVSDLLSTSLPFPLDLGLAFVTPAPFPPFSAVFVGVSVFLARGALAGRGVAADSVGGAPACTSLPAPERV